LQVNFVCLAGYWPGRNWKRARLRPIRYECSVRGIWIDSFIPWILRCIHDFQSLLSVSLSVQKENAAFHKTFYSGKIFFIQKLKCSVATFSVILMSISIFMF